MTTCTTYESSLETQIGLLKVSCCTKGVHSIQIIENENPALYSSIVIKVFETVGGPTCLTESLQWLKGYFEGQMSEKSPDVCEMVLNAKGSFTQLVWRTLKDYPFGNVLTYGDLAAVCKGAARAVGTAMRTNPVPLIVPCHRVVKEGGELGRYSGGGGSRTKQWLLDHEGKVHAAMMREIVQKLNAQKAALESLGAELAAALVEFPALPEEIQAELEAGRAAESAALAAYVAAFSAYQAAWADARAAIEVACLAIEVNVAARAANQAACADARAAIKAACVAIEANIAAYAAFEATRAAEREARREAEEHIQQHHQMADGA